MKKLSLALLLLLIFSFKGFSQDDTRVQIGISLGTSSPMGAFAKKDTNDYTNSGSAKTGFVFNSHIKLNLSKYCGLMFNGVLQVNGFSDYTDASGNTISHNTPWIVTSFLVGPYGIINVVKDEKFTINPKIMIGYADVYTPELDINSSYGSNTLSVGRGLGFAYLAGLDFNFKIGSGFFLVADVAYYHTLSNVGTEDDYGDVNYHANVSSINTTLGIAYGFK